MANLRAEAGKVQVRLEHVVVPENMEALKKECRHAEVTQKFSVARLSTLK
jgi:hypothetical protein